jgi:hypothetical protein
MSSTHKPSNSVSETKSTLSGGNDELTVMVFKDNSSARTFKVSLAWISRLGLIIGVVTAIAVLGVFLSTRFYLTARQASKSGDPAYVQALETENATLKTNLKQAQTQVAAVPAQTQTPSAQSVNSAPVPTVTVTVTATPAAAAPPVASAPVATAALGPGFSALPSSITPDFAGSSISIYEPKVKWSGKTLKVQFFIQYNKEDKGNQQGRIILIARGPQTLMAYPADVFNPGDSPALIVPDKGEYFSVSRIREVKADFGPARTNRDFTSVEVFLLSTDQKLLVHQFLKAPEQAAAPVKAPKAKAAEDTSSDSSGTTPDTSATAQPLTPPTDPAPPAAVSTPAAGAQQAPPNPSASAPTGATQ